VGVGAGTDHLQWARAGCECYGVDLTDTAIETTRAHLALHGFRSDLRRMNAETLPFDARFFDLVYCWGVIHHSAHPERIVSEIHRVLKPNGLFIGMLYRRWSVTSLQFWIRYALKRGRPWRSFADVIGQHVESVGTTAYTAKELAALFAAFRSIEVLPLLTVNDVAGVPSWVSQFFPARWGWFIGVHAEK